MKRRFHMMLTLLVLLSFSASVFGSPIHNGDPNYTRRLWRTQDGLPDQNVQAIAQTPDGYLWIGTKGGLLRFDGAHFVLYDRTTTPGLTESSINCLSVSHDGSLWIGTEGGGLVRYQNESFRAYPTADGLSDSFVRAIFQDSRGTLWVGGDQGLFQVAGAILRRIDGEAKVPTIFVRSIVEDREGHVWVAGTTLLRFAGGTVNEYSLPGGASRNLVMSMFAASDGKLWAGTLTGLHQIDESGILRKIPGDFGTVQCLRGESDGALWIGTLGRGAFRLKSGTSKLFSAPDVLLSNTVLAIFEDRDNNVWMGTQAGLLRLSRSPVGLIAFPDASDSQFETIYQDSDGAVWAASAHLFRIQNGVMRREALPNIPNVRVRTLLRDRHDTLWIGTDGAGLFEITSARTTNFATPKLANDFIRVILEARDGSIWAGTDGGLSHIEGRKVTSYNTPSGLSYFNVTALLEDHAGDLWVGTSRGLSRLHRGIFVKDDFVAKMSHEKVWSIYEDQSDGLWFGTSNGLYRLRGGTLFHYTTAQGLAGNVIYQILEDHLGYLWLSGPTDVTRVERRSVENSLDTREHRPLTLSLYSISQDLDSSELFGGMQPAGFISRQGEVWFPSNKGPVQIQIPDRTLPLSPRFPVRIEAVVAAGRQLAVNQPVVIAPGDGRLEISFAAILLGAQGALRYRYTLEGFDRGWNEVYGRRTAYYTNLPSGKYRFRVAAYETSAPTIVSETIIDVEQRPHFYRTLWFYMVCFGALILAIYLFHQYRLRQISMRFAAVLEERNRVAREMHDTVIQDCIGVSSLLEAVSSSDFTDKALSHELVDTAREQIRTTIDEARVSVWNLRNSEALSGDLSGIISDLAQQMHGKFGRPIHCSVEGEPFAVPTQTAHEVVMIVREALWNAHVHAHSSEIDVSIAFSGKHCEINVRDDGTGFDPDDPTPGSEMHYGLVGMRERAARVGAAFQIHTGSGKGTIVHLRISESQNRDANGNRDQSYA